MSTYCVTFRIADQVVSGKSYTDRYAAFTAAASKGCNGYWAEPTSFILVGSGEDTEAFARRLSGPLSAKHDMLFVFDPEDMSAAYYGAVEHERVLTSFFPEVKKLE